MLSKESNFDENNKGSLWNEKHANTGWPKK